MINVAEDMAVMQKGRVDEAGSAASVLGNPQSAYTEILLAAVPRAVAAAAA